MDDIGGVLMNKDNDDFDFLDELFGDEVNIRGSEESRKPPESSSNELGFDNEELPNESEPLDTDAELLASISEDNDNIMLGNIIGRDKPSRKNPGHKLSMQEIDIDVQERVKGKVDDIQEPSRDTHGNTDVKDEDEFLKKEREVPVDIDNDSVEIGNSNSESTKRSSEEDDSKSGDLKKKKDIPSFIVVVDDEDEVEEEIEENEIEEEDVDEYEEYTEEELSRLPSEIRAAIEWEPPPPKSTPELLVNEWLSTGWVGDLHVDQILTEAIITGASDVHITTDLLVSMTRNGDIIRYDGYPIPDSETMHTVIHDGILGHQEIQILNQEYEYEGAYTIAFGPMAGRRTRLTIGQTFGSYFMVFRIISEHIPTTEDLGVKQEIIDWSHYPNGLFLICGPTGSGKSTTLASVIRELQMTTQKKIITIEKPIEYIYPDDAPSIIVQREVGQDTRSFANGLTSAMRQSPNVILLGEVRNIEEVSELLRAAETGHLAISTMHTNSVATTINRIRNLFEGSEQKRIMSTLADTMRGVGNQVLVKTPDGEGRFSINELLTINDEVRELIIEGDVRGIRQYQIDNKSTMEHNLANAVAEERCTIEDAKAHVVDLDLFESLIE